MGTAPGYWTCKAVYALRRLNALVAWVTIAATLVAVLWFVHDICSLPGWISGPLGLIFGAPQGCAIAP